MASTKYFFVAIISGFNIVWLLAIYGKNFTNEISPKFISSSYDPNATIDFDSLMLNSVNKLLSKYFKESNIISKHVGDLPLGNKKYINTSLPIYHTMSKGSYEILSSPDKKKIFLVSITKVKSQSLFEEYNNIISFFSIPVDNFIIKKKTQFNLNKSSIELKWKTYIKGEIIFTKKSKEDFAMVIYYKVVSGNDIKYHLRYIQLDEVEINNEEENDFTLEGNSAITAIDVKYNAIIYSREIDYSRYYYLIKEKNKWTVKYSGEDVDMRNQKLYTNSLKFFNTKCVNNDTIIVRNTIVCNSTGKYSDFEVISFNRKNESIHTETFMSNYIGTFDFNSTSHFVPPSPIIFSNSICNSNLSISSLLIETKNGVIFEVIYSHNSSFSVKELMISSEYEKKIDTIVGDENLDNIIIKYTKGDFFYINYSKKANDTKYGHYTKKILFDSLPKRFRGKVPQAILMGKYGERVIMTLLTSDSILISCDFTEIVENDKRGKWIDTRYVIFIIIITDIIAFLSAHCKMDSNINRNEEIGRVMNNLVSINNRERERENNLPSNEAEEHQHHHEEIERERINSGVRRRRNVPNQGNETEEINENLEGNGEEAIGGDNNQMMVMLDDLLRYYK